MSTPLSQLSDERLNNKIESILAILRRVSPHEVEELELLLRVKLERAANPGKPYSTVRTPRVAVRMLMAEVGMKMTKNEIYEQLRERGYPVDSSSKKGLLNDAINYMIETGALQSFGGSRGDMIVGPPAKRHASR